MFISPTRSRTVAWPIQAAAKSCLCQVFRLGFGGAEGRCRPSKKRNFPRPRPSQSATRKASGCRFAQSVIMRHFKCPSSQTFLEQSYAGEGAYQRLARARRVEKNNVAGRSKSEAGSGTDEPCADAKMSSSC